MNTSTTYISLTRSNLIPTPINLNNASSVHLNDSSIISNPALILYQSSNIPTLLNSEMESLDVEFLEPFTKLEQKQKSTNRREQRAWLKKNVLMAKPDTTTGASPVAVSFGDSSLFTLPASFDGAFGGEHTIVRYICGFYDEEEEPERTMICRDNCDAWQHNDCMGLTDGYAPPRYFCENCKPEDHKELLAAIARGQKVGGRQ
jgi:hypothetical protein